MLYTRVVTKAALNTLRKSISTIVRKELKISYGSIHHILRPLKLTFQNHFSEDKHLPKFQSLYKIFNRNTIIIVV